MNLQINTISDTLNCSQSKAKLVGANISTFFPEFHWNNASKKEISNVIKQTSTKLDLLNCQSKEMDDAMSYFLGEA